ncbi:ABC transporter permease [Cellulophaga baltica]|uniref:ABC transporter permease n=1 Tax=Cellulophaga TaxID=104264 RepID=UPI001C06D073|nr:MULTISPECIES: ABC transporter permease [Cellulophaga]MBU2996879.1 ABC transporter permease [Cellulophaga baltica]MDO6768276.1 ABC transporter permease [Cellulophaga sp. 1_MG-2023]
MDKLLLIIKREYLAKVRNKSFVIMTFLSPLLMVAMVVLIAFLTKLNDSEKQIITVLNESDFFSNEFVTTETTSYINLKDLPLDVAIDSTENMGYYGMLHIPEASNIEDVAIKTFFYTKEAPSTTVLEKLESIFKTRLEQDRLYEIGVSKQQFATIQEPYTMQTATFSGELNVKGFNEIKAFIGGGFGYLIMMFIIIYGGFVMRSVIEEKTSRIIEVIISSVKPFQLMMGKIIGTSLAGITQFAIWIISASILLTAVVFFFDIDPSSFDAANQMGVQAVPAAMPSVGMVNEKIIALGMEVYKIPWVMLISFFIVYFLLGYLIYSSIYAAIGAAVDNETDTQQFVFPVIMPLMLAIYVGFFSVFNNPHGPTAVAFSLFPLTSPIVMLMRLSSGLGEGGVPIWQLVVSILLLIITFIGIVWFAAKIYRIGILMYGKKPSYKELYKWLKY